MFNFYTRYSVKSAIGSLSTFVPTQVACQFVDNAISSMASDGIPASDAGEIACKVVALCLLDGDFKTDLDRAQTLISAIVNVAADRFPAVLDGLIDHVEISLDFQPDWVEFTVSVPSSCVPANDNSPRPHDGRRSRRKGS